MAISTAIRRILDAFCVETSWRHSFEFINENSLPHYKQLWAWRIFKLSELAHAGRSPSPQIGTRCRFAASRTRRRRLTIIALVRRWLRSRQTKLSSALRLEHLDPRAGDKSRSRFRIASHPMQFRPQGTKLH